MEILTTTLIGVITLFLSAYLAYFFGIQSVRSKEKDEEKKKLKKLLYHLLIVRKAASDKLNFKKRLQLIAEKQAQYMKENLGFSDTEIEQTMPSGIIELQFSLFNSSFEESLFKESERSKMSIDIIIQEFTEIDPLFSLSVKTYDKQLKEIFIDKLISEYGHENEAKIFQQLIVPSLEHKMVMEFDEIIHQITSKLDAKVQREVQELLIHYDDFEVDMVDLKEYMDNMLASFHDAFDKNDRLITIIKHDS